MNNTQISRQNLQSLLCSHFVVTFALESDHRPELDDTQRFVSLHIRISCFPFFRWIKISLEIYEEENRNETTKKKEKIKCVISFRHQSASNRRDLELNSLLPTSYTTLFTAIITYEESCRLRRMKEFLCYKYVDVLSNCISFSSLCMFQF